MPYMQDPFFAHFDCPDVIDMKIVYWMHNVMHNDSHVKKTLLNNQNTVAAALDFPYTFAVPTNMLLNSFYFLITSK